MDRSRMRPIAIAALVLVGTLIPTAAAAQYVNIPLTPREQMSMLSDDTGRASWSKLYPSRTVATVVARPYPLDYRAQYISASLGDRAAIAQIIGEQGVERYAAGRRLKTLLGPRGRGTPIGPDSVYWNRVSGKVTVLEAKGGSSALKWTYGSLQGTNANTIRSAAGSLAQTGTSWREKLQAARVIKAAQSGHLETGVVRTSHVLGTPRAPGQAGGVNVDNVAKAARLIERDLVRRNPELRAVFRKAGFRHRMDRLVHHGTRRMPGSRLASARPPALKGTPPAAIRFAVASSGRSGLQRLWQVGNRWLLPVGLGVAGVTVAITYYQFATGAISYREFLDNSSGSVILVVLTGAGAAIGGALFGFGAIPGAMIGATLALPIQLGLEWFNDQRYSDFRQAQREAVDNAVQELYLRNAVLPNVQ